MCSEKRAEFVLTGFGDEISANLPVQLDTLAEENMHYLELRSIWDKNVLDLDSAEVELSLRELESRGFAISAIASPIGKVPIDADFADHLPSFERALQMATIFGARYLRIFSFYVPQGRADRYRDEVMRRLSILAEGAEAAGVVLLHENERGIFGETPEHCLDIVRSVNSPALRLAFDPANFVQAGVRPFEHAYPLLADYIEYVHIKDALLSDGSTCLPGQGDGEIRELLSALKASGYRGFLSMEPHLMVAGRSFGFSGPAPFGEAVRALRDVLASL